MTGEEITPVEFEERRGKAVTNLLKSSVGKDVDEVELLAEIGQLMPMAQEKAGFRRSDSLMCYLLAMGTRWKALR